MILCVAMLFVLAGCGGGGGDGDEPPAPSGGWVTITGPTTAPTSTEYCNEVYLSGDAFISPTWSAVAYDGTVITGVTVAWYNAATGQSGSAAQRAKACRLPLGPPYPCEHVWWATVPMAVGSNEITLTASDPDGRIGTDTITVDHPERSFNVSGTARTEAGAALSFRESELGLTLSDGSTARRTVTSLDGTYVLDCVRPGVPYSIAPSSPIAYVFTPLQHDVLVQNADLSGLDFTTPAWFLSGQVLREYASDVILVQVNGSGTAASQLADDSGRYRFALPDGVYTVVAREFWGLYTLNPDGWTGEVVINGADVEERDFQAPQR
jgi:hypothetical protein